MRRSRFLEESDSVDLVITDQIMPEMTGSQLAQTVAKRWPELTVMLVTGYAETDPNMSPKVSRLSKPFTQAALAQHIADLGIRPRKGGQIIKFRGNGSE